MTDKDFEDGKWKGSIETKLVDVLESQENTDKKIDKMQENFDKKLDKIQEDISNFNVFKAQLKTASVLISSVISIIMGIVVQYVCKSIFK